MGMFGIGAASVIYLGFNSYTLLQETSLGRINSITLLLHIVLGMLLGISIFVALSSVIAKLHENSPREFQDYLVAGIVLTLIILVLVVIIGNSLGMISLANLR
jgi:uncharacterized protein involved in cysteine biosynthesis